MGLFDNFLKLRQRVNYESEAIQTVKSMSGFNVETLTISQQGNLADSVLHQMKLIGETKLLINDFIVLYFIHAITFVNSNVDASHLAQGAKNFLIKYKSQINKEVYWISIEKLGKFLSMFKESLIAHLGSHEGIKTYDQWFTESGFLDLYMPYLDGLNQTSESNNP